MNKNKINIKVLGKETLGLVDTGAAISCVSDDFIKMIDKSKLKIKKSSCTNIYGVGGEGHSIKGEVTLPLDSKGIVVHYNFLIIANLQYPLILGDDSLIDNKANIHYPSRTLYLHDGTFHVALVEIHNGKAKSIKRICVPAHHVVVIPVYIPKEYENKTVLLEPDMFLAKRQLMGACCLIRTTNAQNRGRIQIINPTENTVVIPRKKKIAIIKDICLNLIQVLSDDDCKDKEKVAAPLSAKNLNSKKKSKLDFHLSQSDLTENEKKKLQLFLNRHREVFAADLSELGKTDVYHRDIDTGDTRPVRIPPYRVAPQVKAEIEKQVEELQKHDIIRPSTSPWNSPVVLVKKKDSTFRFCVDYRKLNAITKVMYHPLAHLNDVFDAIGEEQGRYFSSLDCANGFWQIPLKMETKHKSAFVTHSGVYEWQRLPFGLSNSTSSFQLMINKVLQGLQWKNVLVYVDDILSFSKAFEEHLTHLEQVFSRLKKANLFLKPSKCRFGAAKVNYLGHVLSKDGVQVDNSKIEIVQNYPAPKINMRSDSSWVCVIFIVNL